MHNQNKSKMLRIACFFTIILLSWVEMAYAARTAPFKVGRIRRWINLSYEYTSRDMHDRKKATEHEFEERLHVSGKAFVYHPRLLLMDWNFEFAGQQYRYSENGNSGSDNDSALEYELFGRILKRHRVNFDFRLRSRESIIHQRYGRQYRISVDGHGYGMRWKNKYAPLYMRYDKVESKTKGLLRGRSVDYEIYAADTFMEFSPNRDRTDIDFEKARREESFLETDYITDYVMGRVTNLIKFGKKRRHFLRSYFRYRDDSGTIPGQALQWSEHLNMSPGKALKTGIYFDYRKTRRPRVFLKNYRTGAWASHRLFQSLTTNLRFEYQKSDFDTGDETRKRGEIGFSYEKKVKEINKLFAAFKYTRELVNNNSGEDSRFIGGELMIIQDLQPNYLLEFDVLESSIVVRNQNGSRIFIEGVDYEVVTTGRRTEIVRLLGGEILPGETLRIDYQVKAEPYVEYLSKGKSFMIGSSLSRGKYFVYARANMFDQEHVSGRKFGFHANRRRIYTTGFRSHFRNLYCNLEYSLDKFDGETTNRFFGAVQYTLRRTKDVEITLWAEEKYQFYTGLENGNHADNFDQYFKFGTRYRRRLLARNMHLNLSGYYLDQRGRVGDGYTMGLRGYLTWRINRSTVQTGSEFEKYKRDNIKSTGYDFFVNYRRAF